MRRSDPQAAAGLKILAISSSSIAAPPIDFLLQPTEQAARSIIGPGLREQVLAEQIISIREGRADALDKPLCIDVALTVAAERIGDACRSSRGAPLLTSEPLEPFRRRFDYKASTADVYAMRLLVSGQPKLGRSRDTG